MEKYVKYADIQVKLKAQRTYPGIKDKFLAVLCA